MVAADVFSSSPSEAVTIMAMINASIIMPKTEETKINFILSLSDFLFLFFLFFPPPDVRAEEPFAVPILFTFLLPFPSEWEREESVWVDPPAALLEEGRETGIVISLEYSSAGTGCSKRRSTNSVIVAVLSSASSLIPLIITSETFLGTWRLISIGSVRVSSVSLSGAEGGITPVRQRYNTAEMP